MVRQDRTETFQACLSPAEAQSFFTLILYYITRKLFSFANCQYIYVFMIKIILYRNFVSHIERPFGVRLNPYTQSVEILSNAQKIAAIVSELKGDLCIVRNALQKIQVFPSSGKEGLTRSVMFQDMYDDVISQ